MNIIVRLIVWFVYCVAAASSLHAADIPPGMLDFDRQVGFSKPLLASVFRAYNDEHTYYVLPNVSTLDKLPSGAANLTLIYEKSATGREAFLTLGGTVGFAGDHDKAVAEILARDGAAKFVVPEPVSFSFDVHTPGSDGHGATIENAKIDSAGHFEILAKVSDITARILLIPGSYKFDAFAVVYSPVYHGVVRREDGTPAILERSYDVGVVGGGACALFPDRYISWVSDRTGCVYPRYVPLMLRQIQKPLKERGLYTGAVDGVYGPLTSRAIRKYQTANSLVADGIPTLDLVEMLGK